MVDNWSFFYYNSKKRKRMDIIVTKTKLSIRELAYVALFSALIVAFSQVSIPMPIGLPMTLQTFVIPLAGVVLGAKLGTLSVLGYLLIGIVGLPVFSGGGSGIGWFLGPTGGFLFGFPFYALCAGIGAQLKKQWTLVLGLLLGMVITYLFGMLQFAFVTGQSIPQAFFLVVFQFMPTEIIKLAFVWVLGGKIRKLLEASGYLL